MTRAFVLGVAGASLACSAIAGLSTLAFEADRQDAGTPPYDDAAAAEDAGLGYGLVFVSSVPHEGRFPSPGRLGVEGADAFCRELADRSPLAVVRGRTWRAWLTYSTEVDARSRLPLVDQAFPLDFRLVDGRTTIFGRGFNFDVLVDGGPSLPSHPITINERGETVLPTLKLWTGSLDNGRIRTEGETCGGWNLDAPDAAVGRVGRNFAGVGWAAGLGADSCATTNYVLCFEANPR